MILCLTALLLLFTACEKTCSVKKPKDVKPIDWENYNDVYTVYWNYSSVYSKRKQEDEGKIIKISGWITQHSPPNANLFALCDDSKYAIRSSGYKTSPPIMHIDGYFVPGLQAMLDSCDLTKKCFIKGKLGFREIPSGFCTGAMPIIEITDINDIYFD